MKALNSLPLFRGLSDGDLEPLRLESDEVLASHDDVLFRQGDLPEAVYIVTRGAVRIVQRAGDQDRELATLTKGEIFGEMGVLRAIPRSASAVVWRGADLIRIGRGAFTRFLASHPEVAKIVRSTMVARGKANPPMPPLEHPGEPGVSDGAPVSGPAAAGTASAMAAMAAPAASPVAERAPAAPPSSEAEGQAWFREAPDPFAPAPPENEAPAGAGASAEVSPASVESNPSVGEPDSEPVLSVAGPASEPTPSVAGPASEPTPSVAGPESVSMQERLQAVFPDLAESPEGSREPDGGATDASLPDGGAAGGATPPSPVRDASAVHEPSSAQNEVGDERLGVVVGLFSASGGVGVSLVAANLAVALREASRRRVLVWDLDLAFGDQDEIFGLAGGPTLSQAVEGGDLDWSLLKACIQDAPSGVDVLCSPESSKDAERLMPGFVIACLEVLRLRYDYLICDVGQAIDAVCAPFLELVDLPVYVLTPEVMRVKRAQQWFGRMGKASFPLDEVGLLFNQCGVDDSEAMARAEARLRRKAVGRLPLDVDTARWTLNSGLLVVKQAANTPLAKGFEDIAERVAEATTEQATTDAFWRTGVRV